MDPIIYEQNRQRMSKMGMGFGISALISSILMFTIPYVAMILAGFGILVSFLSKGTKDTYDRESKIGMTTSVIALVVCCFVIGCVIVALKTNPEYRQNVLNMIELLTSQEQTGQTYSSLF